MTKIPGVPPTILGPVQRQAQWPPPKLTVVNWGAAILRGPNGSVKLCFLSPDGAEGFEMTFDALGWASFARDIQATLASNGSAS